MVTRDQGVLETFQNYDIYEVELNNDDEATKLFCQNAFEQEDIPDSLVGVNNHVEENVEKVVQKCNGLPLTVEVMGSYLRGHETNVRIWEETVDKLGKAQSFDRRRDDRVWASLRLSYDALSPEEQEMFIDSSTYVFGRPVREALGLEHY